MLLLAAGVLVVTALYRVAVPWVADKAAAQIPTAMVKTLSQEVYNDMLSEGILTPSHLPEYEQRQAQLLFAEALANAPVRRNMHLRLHRLGKSGEDANAFALPDGTIVMSNALMRLLSNKEITAELAHEVGHVHHRHSLRLMAQVSISATLALLITGDFTGFSLAPIALLQLIKLLKGV